MTKKELLETLEDAPDDAVVLIEIAGGNAYLDEVDSVRYTQVVCKEKLGYCLEGDGNDLLHPAIVFRIKGKVL